MISAVVQTNALLDPRRLPRPRYAHVPQLRVGTVSKHVRPRVSKRDARHYFHRLKLGAAWRPYLAHPPVYKNGKKMYPRHVTAAMGLGPSSGWAQALTDQTTQAAALPVGARVLIDEPIPPHGPWWGSIVDDVWAIDTVEEPRGKEWCEAVEAAWTERGVETHAGKIVNEKEVEEVQGVWVHPATSSNS